MKKDSLLESLKDCEMSINEMKKANGGEVFRMVSKTGYIFCVVTDSGCSYYDVIGNKITASSPDNQLA